MYQTSAIISPSTDDSSREDRLKQYLLDYARDGEMYFKGKSIADDVSPSPKEIDALMVKLHGSATGLPTGKWSCTSTTTRRVETARDTRCPPRPTPAPKRRTSPGPRAKEPDPATATNSPQWPRDSPAEHTRKPNRDATQQPSRLVTPAN